MECVTAETRNTTIMVREASNHCFVGAVLRGALLEQFSSCEWSDEQAACADRMRDVLEQATAHGDGYLLSTERWTPEDYDFLRDCLDEIDDDIDHSERSRGQDLSGSVISCELREFRRLVG